MSAWVLIPLAVMGAVLAALYRLCRAASEPLFDEQFRHIPPPLPQPLYSIKREPRQMLNDAGEPLPAYGCDEVLVTASGVRIPLTWFENDGDLDVCLRTLEEIDGLASGATGRTT